MSAQSQAKTSLWRAATPAVLIALPVVIALLKARGAPAWLDFGAALGGLSRHGRHHLETVLLIPLSTMLAAFFRLALGLRMFSIYRPVLIAIAFETTGVPLGLLFLAVVLGAVVAAHPVIKGRPYYARVPVIAALIAAILVAAVIAFERWQYGWMMSLAYFPSIALCLTCESFAKTLRKAGPAEALWRATTTTAAAIAVLAVARIPGLMPALTRNPEWLLAEAGCVLLIAERFNYRALEGWNPFARKARVESPAGAFAPVERSGIVESAR